MKKEIYLYNAHVDSVYDGDTVTVTIDLGLKTFIKGERVRLFGINAPEVRGKERNKGLMSRDFLREQILGKDIIIRTIKDKKGKYGRYLGELFLEKETGRYININDLLVKKGFAKEKEY